MSILFYQTYAQTTWSERRDWVVGLYEGYYVHGDTAAGIWYPISFEIVYHANSSNVVRIRGFSDDLSFAVCEDSLLGGTSSIYVDSCRFYSPFTGDGGKLYPDSTYEHWYYCPPASCYEYENWRFFRGRKVESYANSVNQIINSTKVDIFPNPFCINIFSQ